FGSAAYGRPPGMNIFENDLSPYFSAGLRLRWPVWDRGSVRRERRTAELRQALVDAEQDAFLQSVEVEAAEIRADIERLHRAIDQDAQILQFRERLAQRAADQLENGTISVTDYLIHQEAVHRARLNEKRHRLELTFAHIRHRNTLGDRAANSSGNGGSRVYALTPVLCGGTDRLPRRRGSVGRVRPFRGRRGRRFCRIERPADRVSRPGRRAAERRRGRSRGRYRSARAAARNPSGPARGGRLPHAAGAGSTRRAGRTGA